jgi:LysR family transcriptional regulator, glycine cleavage system transcriptional activator
MSKLPPLRSLAVFESAARNGSFWRAADELHITKSAVSHHIKSLELFLKTPLFLRLSKGVRLTVEGASYYESIQEAYRHINHGTQRFLGSPQRDILTLRCGVSFGYRWLTPRLPLFLSEYPGIDLKVVTPTAKLDTRPEPVDVEIKYGSGNQPGMHCEPLLEENIVPMCSPALLKGGGLREPADLGKFRLIESELSAFSWSSWLTANRVRITEFSRLRFDNIILALQAAVSGLGVALEGDFLASEELAAGRLVVPPALRGLVARKSLRNFIVPETQAKSEKVLLFRDWLFRMIRD